MSTLSYITLCGLVVLSFAAGQVAGYYAGQWWENRSKKARKQENKAAIKREQTKARFQFAEREQARNKISTFQLFLKSTNIAINKQINKAYNNGSNKHFNQSTKQRFNQC